MTLPLLPIIGAIALFALFVFWTEPLWLLPGLERLTPNIVYRVHTRLPVVALSFDDGPHPTFTPQVLDLLQGYDAKATFFLIGDRALRHPDVVAAIRVGGHGSGIITRATFRRWATRMRSLFASSNRPKRRWASPPSLHSSVLPAESRGRDKSE